MAKKKSSGKVIVGASAVALAAASYYFFGPKGKKHRHELSSWAIKMKGDVVEKLENAKDVSKDAYDMIVDAAATKYAAMKNVSKEELAATVKNLKAQWKNIAGGKAMMKKKAKSAVKKASKKMPAKKKSSGAKSAKK